MIYLQKIARRIIAVLEGVIAFHSLVLCLDGSLRVEEVQRPGGREGGDAEEECSGG